MARTCNLCKQKVPGLLPGFIEHGEQFHPEYYVGNIASNAWRFVPKRYFDPFNQEWFSDLGHFIRAIKAHGYTKEAFFLFYGRECMPEEWKHFIHDEKYGTANCHNTCLECLAPAGWDDKYCSYNVFCGFSCSTTWHSKHTDRVEQSLITKSRRLAEDPNFMLIPTQKQYWINKGHTEEEATEQVKQRQTTTSLEAFILRYGEEEGLQRHAKRNLLWLESLKPLKGLGVPKISLQLFDALDELFEGDLLYGDDEFIVSINNKNYKLDCYNQKNNKAIEFFGDYWHANPKKYTSDRIIKSRPAHDIWGADKVRLHEIEMTGVEVKVVWEGDFRTDPANVLVECVKYLND